MYNVLHKPAAYEDLIEKTKLTNL